MSHDTPCCLCICMKMQWWQNAIKNNNILMCHNGRVAMTVNFPTWWTLCKWQQNNIKILRNINFKLLYSARVISFFLTNLMSFSCHSILLYVSSALLHVLLIYYAIHTNIHYASCGLGIKREKKLNKWKSNLWEA